MDNFVHSPFTQMYRNMKIFVLFFVPLLVDDVKTLSVMEGDSVTLQTDVTEIQKADLILWTFGPERTRIAQINRQVNKLSLYDDVLDGRFRDRLSLDNQTGSLTITNTTTEHSGVYELHIPFGGKEVPPRKYNIIVSARLPVPVIISNSSHCSSSSSSSCSLVCSSVVNVSHVTLSWYAGISVSSSISVCDLSISLSLPLEVEYQDKNTYSCVLNNPISNQTTHLDINTLCHTCAGVFGVDAVKSVLEGDSVTLHAGLTEIQKADLILWTFGPDSTRIAQINRQVNKVSLYDDILDGRFRGRLHLDDQTGDLTIMNIRTEHFGLYELLHIFGDKDSEPQKISIIVSAPLPVPVISSNSSHCSSSSSSSSCSLVCSSVVNVSHVTLSWYKGISVLSSISVSDLSFSLSLPLEVEYQDKNTYSCVLNNPISNQTTHLDINTLCHTCSVIESTIKTEGGLSSSHIVLICVFVGIIVLAVAAVGIFISHRKYRNTDQMAEEVVGEKDEMKTVSVTLGESVTLNTGITEMQSLNVLQWKFGKSSTDKTNPFKVIARLNDLNNSGCRDHDDRVHLDRKTGYLTINDIRPTDLGIYKLDITENGRNMISKTFIVQDSSEREDEQEETNSLMKNGQISESSCL
ncbi:uncharacterized protein LOC143734881 isoform X1 [Siphateles boraxobius]|uniref:uncharacterized protein LOC143734881 isoform X1 n=1 Tax=Siphateles boraxobius TaxID=180520 RepID=UPI004062BA78